MADTRLSITVRPQVDFTDMIRQLREAADALEAAQRADNGDVIETENMQVKGESG